MISVKRITAPSEEPVTLAEAKVQLRIEGDDASPATTHPDDALVLALIETSRDWAERFSNRAYITQTWRLSMDAFPAEKYIKMPLPPLQSLVSLSYWDGSAVRVVSFLDPSGTALLETDDYIVDIEGQPGRLCLKPGRSWPAVETRANAVQVEFVAGYGDAAYVPERVKTAIKLRITDMYENRGDQPSDPRYKSAAEMLLWMDRIIPI